MADVMSDSLAVSNTSNELVHSKDDSNGHCDSRHEVYQRTVDEFMSKHTQLFHHLWSKYEEKRRHKPFDRSSIPEDSTEQFHVQPIDSYLQTNEMSDFIESMTSSQSFDNPSAIDNIKGPVFGLSCSVRPTLLDCLLMKDIPESEYSEGLKYTQRSDWSMELTGTGIKHFKNGNTKKAKEYFDFALSVDHANVECLVARGALQANLGLYEESIVDFDDAVDYNPSHKNAGKYLVETCIAYGDSLCKIDNEEKALELYEKALSVDPSSELVKGKVDEVSALIRRKTALREEIERKKHEEDMKLRKLKKIIRKEKRKMAEYDMHGPKAKSSKKKKKRSKGRHHAKKRSRHYSSSSSSTS